LRGSRAFSAILQWRILQSRLDVSCESFTLNCDGLRAWKQDASGKTYYLYDGDEPVYEMNSEGTVTATNVFAPDGLVARQSGTGWTYYTFDAQGDVSQRLDSSQSVISSSTYDAFGAETTTGTTPTDCFGYNAQSGYLFDRDTGLYLCQHRYYDPSSGRWVTRDPIGYGGGIGLYAYCGNGPVGWVDAAGLRGGMALLGGVFGGIVGFVASGFDPLGAYAGAMTGIAMGAAYDKEHDPDYSPAKEIAQAALVLAPSAADGAAGLALGEGPGDWGVCADPITEADGWNEWDDRVAAVRAKVPQDWIERPADKDDGVKWVDPNNRYNSVRYDPPDGGTDFDHIHVNDKGTVRGRGGIDASDLPRWSLVRHILPDDWLGWRRWNRF